MPVPYLPPWLQHFLIWLNHPSYRFWTLALALTALTFALTLCVPENSTHIKRKWWQRGWFFGSLILLTLAAFRWPTWFIQNDLNPDESQIIAGAITLRHFPIYWKYVDAMTQGPLNAYALVAASWVGLPLNFFGPRVFALFLEGGALIATWRALRNITGETTARLGIFPALLFWGFVAQFDFINYSSELVSIFITALAVFFATRAFCAKTPRPLTAGLFASGFCLGAIPFAKLQCVPVALAVALCVFITGWMRRSAPEMRTALRWFVASGVVPFLLVSAGLSIHGLWPEFWQVYIQNNLWYVSSQAEIRQAALPFFLNFTLIEPAFAWFWWGGILFAISSGLLVLSRASAISLKFVAASWFALAAAVCAVTTPGRPLTHYLQIIVIPLTWLITLHLHGAREWTGSRLKPHILLLAGFALFFFFPQALNRYHHTSIYVGQFTRFYYEHPVSQAAYFIRERMAPRDTLAMWGWRAQLFVETGLPQGTREAQTERQLTPGPMQRFYQDRYVNDMTSRRPEWFVDAVGPASMAYQERSLQSHETLPELAALVRRDYEFVAEIEHLRIYRLRTPGPRS